MDKMNSGWARVAGVVLALALAGGGPVAAQSGDWGGGWSVKVDEDQNGNFNANLVNKTYDGVSEHVGTFESRREARQAAREARRDKEDGAEASAETESVIDTGEMCNNPLFNC